MHCCTRALQAFVLWSISRPADFFTGVVYSVRMAITKKKAIPVSNAVIESSSPAISQRINRVIGQLKGIQKMAESGRDCTEIIQQVAAVKKAIDSITEEVLIHDVLPYIPPIRQKVVKDMIHRSISL